jgi:putative intracellular protease/amidase
MIQYRYRQIKNADKTEEKDMTVYVYVLDTLADWELGHTIAELHSRRFFKKDAPELTVKTVSCSKEPIVTMGGMTVVPDCLIDDVTVDESSVLLLPGADTWSDPKHGAIIQKAAELLAVGAPVCGICGATVALAGAGLLDRRPHTSNGAGFLDMMAPGYHGKDFYVDEPAVADGNLITAACTGALPFAKLILGRLGVFSDETMAAWYAYFSTGRAEDFFALMQSLPSNQKG